MKGGDASEARKGVDVLSMSSELEMVECEVEV